MDKKVLMNEILTLLNKVNRQAQILVHLPNMARIDVDLLLAEIRQVYDKTLDLQIKIETSRLEPKPEVRSTPPLSSFSEFSRQAQVPITPKVEEPLLFTEPEPEPEPEQDPEPETENPVSPTIYEYTPPPKIETSPSPVVTSFPAPVSTPVASPIASSQPKSLHQAYEEQSADHSIAARLQYNPINDLRSAIGINDKFLLMNQLFKGSLEQYNSAIERLNNFYSYDDAEIFLGSLKILHDWADDLSGLEKLSHFVKRRYQKE